MELIEILRRGTEQDNKNMENILGHITYYKEIHAILVLLKPDNSRLTVFFRHCIQQLLTHLHKDAAKNLIFVYTSARQTNYRPGNTHPMLNKLLADKKIGTEARKANTFCFDNEAFRYLAIVLQYPGFVNEMDMRLYRESWNKAHHEFTRMYK